MKKKPKGERALVDFTRRVFAPPAWHVKLHSRGVNIEPTMGSVKGEWILPRGVTEKNSLAYYLHGGGYISGSAKTNRPITVPLTRRLKRHVFSLDYRLAPEHRFPAAVEDAVAGYRWLVSTGIDPRVSISRRRFCWRRSRARAGHGVTRHGRQATELRRMSLAVGPT